MKARLTKFQRDELRYKLDVMESAFEDDGKPEEGSMAEYYGVKHRDELDAMIAKVDASLVMDFTERELAIAYGELGNAYDIASGNVEESGDEYDRAARKLRDGMNRLMTGR